MINTKILIREWQQALQQEILHLKKFGGNKFLVTNGTLLNNDNTYSYYFETLSPLRIPVGSQIRLEWGSRKNSGRVLSSEGKSVIVSLEHSFGDLISEAYLLHDPWELLEQLIERLDEIRKSKTKRSRIKKLMEPSMEARHPAEKVKSSVHELVLRSKYNYSTYVWGPPGTGKTYTLARTAANKYFQKKKVLILSHSNQAVDVLISEIHSFIQKKNRFQEGDVLRYGSQTGETLASHEGLTTYQLIEKLDPALAEDRVKLFEERRQLKQDLSRSFSRRDSNELLELETRIARVLDKVRQREIEFLKEAYIIGTTLAKAASDSAIYEKEYDVVILDEASMAYVPQAGFATSLGKRVIICGDFKQLPPIASSRDALVSKWLKEDVFHRAGIVDYVDEGKLHPQLFLLKEQRRMHPEISAFTNKYIYESLVSDHESVHTRRNRIASRQPFPERASVLVDTSHTGMHGISEATSNSRINLWQLLLSFQLIHESVLGGSESIGYVTPYRAQANLMEMLLQDIYEKERQGKDIIAATVHKFQGSERDVMIFDSVDGGPQDRAGMLLTGKDSERLINVAITRTRGKFVHVCNGAFMRKHVYRNKTIRQLVEHQVQQQQMVAPSQIGTWVKNQHPALKWMHARKLEPVFEDLVSASSSIVICVPGAGTLSQEWQQQLSNKKTNVTLALLCEKKTVGVQADQWLPPCFPFPFVIIDEKILWLGLPLEGASGVEPPFVSARLASKNVCEYMLGQVQAKDRQ
ncbi:DNA helicase [Mesobacillus campisalis]|uniref:DNA helicase n=1 Tax=Mesobacillus campisalis TaxID=1408103 RepID=A0A0M2SUC0_9BACI|nr:AAA domain-containing protein [Mesobacillus campisalis]KKK37743.1 DNA helicase [Mesobacillus campisalis]